MAYLRTKLIVSRNSLIAWASFLLMALSLSPLPVAAVKTKIWEQKGTTDFREGTAKSVAISSQGEVILHQKLETIFDKGNEVYVWCLAEDSNGNVYAGTGNGGKIYQISPTRETELFFDSPEVSILSLAIDDQDRIYAGTAPSGLVYRIDDNKTPPTTILSAEENYVWDLAFDDNGNLYAATGTEGKIYKIPTTDAESEDVGGEQPSVFFNADETNIVSLLFHQGNLYAGSDGKATIFKISLDGQAAVIHQTGQKEVKTLVGSADGSVFAGTVTTVPPKPGQRPSGPPSPDGRPPEINKSQVYQVRPNGTIRSIWNSPEPLILAIQVYQNHLIVGTGDNGKIYRVTLDGESIEIANCKAKQVLALLNTDFSKTTWVATGNQGKVFQLSANYVDEGTLESKAYDAQLTSQWGKLSWVAMGNEISFSTRSGNTSQPDNTWSDWSKPISSSEDAQITSPDARFLQWQAKLKSASQLTILKQVRFGSVQLNVEPRIGDFQVHIGAPKERENRNGPPQRNGNNIKTDKRRTAKWEVNDPNGDQLQYTLYYKKETDDGWQLLKDELKKPIHTWDSTAMPDGRYHLKVFVSDQLNNQFTSSLYTEKISKSFEIDNTQPDIGQIEGVKKDDGTYQISCVVEDSVSPIKSAVYKIDNDENWQIIFPADMIFDSRREELIFTTKPIVKVKSKHTIAIRVVDSAGNETIRGTSF